MFAFWWLCGRSCEALLTFEFMLTGMFKCHCSVCALSRPAVLGTLQMFIPLCLQFLWRLSMQSCSTIKQWCKSSSSSMSFSAENSSHLYGWHILLCRGILQLFLGFKGISALLVQPAMQQYLHQALCSTFGGCQLVRAASCPRTKCWGWSAGNSSWNPASIIQRLGAGGSVCLQISASTHSRCHFTSIPRGISILCGKSPVTASFMPLEQNEFWAGRRHFLCSDIKKRELHRFIIRVTGISS